MTNILQLRTLDSQKPNLNYFVRLEGIVLWANPGQGRFVLQDTSGADELEMAGFCSMEQDDGKHGPRLLFNVER